MATPMEVDMTVGQAPVASAGLGRNTMTNAGRSERSPVIKCIYGCAINPSEEAIPLFCMHFICSDACAAKLKAKFTPENPLVCPLCELFIMPRELERKIIPDSIFAKKSENGDPNLRCQACVWSHPAVAYCRDCSAFLCQRCEMQHPEAIATKEHVITKDLSEHTQQQMEEVSLSEIKDNCGDHDLPLTMFCENCDRKICPECHPTHQEHATFNLHTEFKKLEAKINLARKLTSVSESAIADLRIKRQELLKDQWEDITTHITEQFEKLIQVLLRREEELQVQAREIFMRQLAEQNKKITSAEHAKRMSDRFVANAEGVLRNGPDISCIKFLREYQKLIQWLCNVDKKISQEYDEFVEKGKHFELFKGVSIKGAIQKLLSGYCHVKFLDKNQHTSNPSMSTFAPTSTSSTQAQATPGPSTSFGNDGSGRNRRFRRVPRKSTQPSQSTGNILQANVITYTPLHVRLAKYKATLLQPTADTVNAEVIDLSSDDEDNVTLITVDNEVEVVTTQAETGFSGEQLLDERGIPDVQVVSNSGRSGQVSNNGAELEKLVMDTDVTMEDDGSGEEEVVFIAHTPNVSITNVVNDAPRSKVVADPSMSTVAVSPPVSNVAESVTTMGTVAANPPIRNIVVKHLMSTVVVNPALKNVTVKPSNSDVASGPSTSTVSAGPSTSTGASKPSITIACTIPAGLLAKKRQRVDTSLEEHNITEESSPRTALRRSPRSKPRLLTSSLEDVMGSNQSTISNETDSASTSQSLCREFELQRQSPGSSGKMENRSNAVINFDILLEAPWSSFEKPHGIIKHACNLCDYDNVTLQICCDECDKAFHLNCHAPAMRDVPEGSWICNFHPTKEEVDQLISTFPEYQGSEKWDLIESNQRHFQLACKFVMECYKIPEIRTVRFFAAAYYKMFKKVPFSLKYIRERLILRQPELRAFSGVQDMMLSYRQMFLQAFRYYGTQSSMELRTDVANCLRAFMKLIQEYYPQYSQLFDDVIPV